VNWAGIVSLIAFWDDSCLSDDAGNPARALYERFGFGKASATGDSITMLRRSDRGPVRSPQ